MKIVVINDSSVARGGATGLALLSVKKFIELGYDVTYICGDDGDDNLSSMGVTIVPLSRDSLLKGRSHGAMVSGLYNYRAYQLLVRFIESNDTEETIYHVHGWAQILSPSIFHVLRRVKQRVFIHAHDFFLACPNGGFMDYKEQRSCEKSGGSFNCVKTNCDKRSYTHKLWRLGRHVSLRLSLKQNFDGFTILAIHRGVAQKIIQAGYVSANVKLFEIL